MRLLPRSLAAAFCVLCILPVAARAQDVGLPIGSLAAPVHLEDLDGNPVDLAQYIGRRPVLIEFWATWCPICRELEPTLTATAAKHKAEADVLVVAVGVNQTTRSIKRHLAKHPMPGRVLWDGAGRATRAFMAPSTSYVVILDSRGRVTYTGTGSEQELDAALTRAIAAK
jgi:thiol-disulfide isomerase/thioredoxin